LPFVEFWNLTPPFYHLPSLCCPTATHASIFTLSAAGWNHDQKIENHYLVFTNKCPPSFSPSLPHLFLLLPPHSFGTQLPSLLPPLLPLPLVSSSFESAHHFCIQMKRLTAPCLCTVNHCCRAAKQKQYLVAAPAPVKAVKPSPLISSSSLLLMTARRLRAIVIFLLQGSNTEAAATSPPLLIQHQLLPPLPPCRCRRCRCVIAVAALAAARRLRAVVLFFILYLLQGSNAEAASTLSPLLHQHAPLQRRS
jgi:hypothetical protein